MKGAQPRPTLIKMSKSIKSPELIQRAALRKAGSQSYQSPIVAKIWDAQFLNGILVGRAHDHIDAEENGRFVDGSIIQTMKIQHVDRNGEFWVVGDARGSYAIATFREADGEDQLLKLTGELSL